MILVRVGCERIDHGIVTGRDNWLMIKRNFMVLTSVVLLACTGGTVEVAGAPKAIEAYLQARVKADADKMIALSCADWEAKARVEATSAKSQNEQLQDVACTLGAADGNAQLVQCSGKILNSYNGETRERNLSEFTFRTVADGGEWRMCGYK
jgi:hypothetical protein